MMNKGLTYIIIVNYGNWEDTLECVNSIISFCKEYKIVLVDVVNKNNSISELNRNISFAEQSIHLIELDINNGYAYANNIGIKHAMLQADCEYLWLLNNDAIITKTTLVELKRHYLEKENIGFLGSKILDYYNREIIQTVGGSFNQKTGYSILIGMGEKDNGQYDNSTSAVDYIIGAGMFFDKELIDKIGLMPEEYFLYYEDVDWCLIAKQKGLFNYVCTDSVVYHKQGQSTGNVYFNNNVNFNTIKYLYINYLKIYRKHFPKQIYIAYLILFKQFLGKLVKGQFKEARIILHSILFNK